MGFFDFLIKIFQRLKGKEPLSKTKAISFSFSENHTIFDLQEKVKQIGHSKHPFLHREYSPFSRIPCTDFSSFIIGWLKAKDYISVSMLMQSIIEANPGIGTDGEWITDQVMEVVRADFTRYLIFEEQDVYDQLKAMWIIASKDGGGREFWTIGDMPKFFSQALSPFKLTIKPTFDGLRKKANKFIRKMRKEVPYSVWEDIKTFVESDLTIPQLEVNESLSKVRNLSIGARLLLFYAVSQCGGPLPKLAYIVKDFGIYPPEASSELIASELVVPCCDHSLIKDYLSKEELISFCIKTGVTYKKSWNKDRIIMSISQSKDDSLTCLANEYMLVVPNSIYSNSLNSLLSRSEKLEPLFKILCFI